MELEFDKEDLEKLPVAWSKELVKAVTDYMDGKKDSEKRLRELVNREISENYYNQLVERYGSIHRINKYKKEREHSRKIKRGFCIAASIIILSSSMLCTLAYLIERSEKATAVCFFFLWIFAFGYMASYKD